MTFFVVASCVDPIHFDSPPPRDLIILDGAITDDEGPYVVRISRGLRLEADTMAMPVTGAKIVLHSNEGEVESLTEVEPGKYQTGGVIRGVVGNSYYIDLEMPDGATFASQPEEILPSGAVTNIRYQYEARVVKKFYGELPADVFNIFIDADNAAAGADSYVRWRFSGTYKVTTNPELHTTWLQGCCRFETPYPCSGFEVEPGPRGGAVLVKKRECTCCTCYVKDFESSPRLSDNEFAFGQEFRNLKVGEVPITRSTFFEKYRVEVEQMTVTKNAFDFFKVVRSQKDGAASLFQVPPGRVRGNIKPVNADYEIIGLFWGASINRKAIYIKESDLPYLMPADEIQFPCVEVFANSTTTKPDFWED